LTEAQLGGPDCGWFADDDALGLPVAQSSLTVNTGTTQPPPAP